MKTDINPTTSCIKINRDKVARMCEEKIDDIIAYRAKKDAEVLKRRRLPRRREYQFFDGRIQFGKWLPEETDAEVWHRIGDFELCDMQWEWKSEAYETQLDCCKSILAAALNGEGRFMFLSVEDFKNIN